MTRQVTIASCAIVCANQPGSSSRQQLQAAAEALEEAGRRGADIACLPEYACAPIKVGAREALSLSRQDLAPFTDLAAKHRMYVIAPFVEASPERDGKPYNSAAVIDRQGQIIGRYRKTHLCLPGFEEGEQYAAGDELPVFDTDFGRIGIAICMDIHYPELFTTMALRGAEIIFWPTAAMDYTGDLIESLVNARAIDNQVFVVPSHYVAVPYLSGRHYGRSRVVDPMGRIRADTGHFPGVAVANVDLEQTYPMWYQGQMLEAYPDMRRTLFKTRRPELYGDLVQPVSPGHWTRPREANG